jgi:uncharacterized membrane protein YoaK (UPF0700 family)
MMIAFALRAFAPAKAALVRGWGLAFVAGYIDAVGFSALFGQLPAHITGSFVMIGIALVKEADHLLASLLSLPIFVISIACTRFAEIFLRNRRLPVASVLCFSESLLLVVFMASGLCADPSMPSHSPTALLTGCLAVAAMGIQNAMSRTVLMETGPTTVMTGNTAQLVIDVVDLSRADPAQKNVIKHRIVKAIAAVTGFTAGVIGGSLAHAYVSLWSVTLPVAVLSTLAIRLWRSS